MSYPLNWKKVKFGEIARRKSIRINNPKQSMYKRYVGLEHLESGELVVRKWGSTNDISSSMQIFKKNDILFARRNTYLRRISVALFDGICSGDIIVIEPILKEIVEGFLPICMQFEEFENKVIAWSAGAFSKRIKWDQLSNFDIWIPSKEEQTGIVNLLWKIQNNQEKTENLLKTTEKVKKELVEELFTRGINNKIFKTTELRKVPINWSIKTLGEVTKIKARIGWRGLKSEEYTKEGPYLIAATHIIDSQIKWEICDHISEFRYEESSEIKLEIGDTILSKDGTIGRVGFIDALPGKATINGTMMLLRPNNEIFIPKFIYYYLQGSLFQDLVKERLAGSTIPHLFQRDIKNLIVPIPPKTEQIRIISLIEHIDDSLYKIKKNLEIKSRLKKNLCNEFLSGKLLIPEIIS